MRKNLPSVLSLTRSQFDETKIKIIFDRSTSMLQFDVQKAETTQEDKEAVALAKDLIERARQLELEKIKNLLKTQYNGSIFREFGNPVSFTDSGVQNQPWADKGIHPLEENERWNYGRRATNTGIRFGTDLQSFPINPYFNYGIQGRGTIGRFGPNHAVDIGALAVKENGKGKKTLHALGIVRGDNGFRALCGGFTTFNKDKNGLYRYGREAVIESQAMEFFEEMVSGSVALIPEYAEGLAEEIKETLEKNTKSYGKKLSDKTVKVITNQVITHRKVQQVEKEDPEFFENLKREFSNAQTCYAGPVLSSSRNTNSAWMETRLSWFMLDDEKWERIKGKNKFNYELSAGDDAQDVMWHEITPNLIENAESHSALFVYLLSSYLLNPERHDKATLESVKEQAKGLMEAFPHAPTPAPPKLAYTL